MNEENVTQSLAPQPKTDTGPKIDSITIWILGIVLMINTGYHSYNILAKSVSESAKVIALVGLFGLEFGLAGWGLAYAKGATTGVQKMLAKTFIVIDALGVLVTSLADSLMYSSSDGAYEAFGPLVMFFIPIIIVSNAFAAFAYKLNDEQVVEDRKARDREYERRQRLAIQADLIQREKDDLEYATTWNLYRQQMIGLQENLAQVKVALDAREQANRQILSSGKHVEQAAQAMGFPVVKTEKAPLFGSVPKINIPAWMKKTDAPEPEPVPIPVPAGHEYTDQGGALGLGTGNGSGTQAQRQALQMQLSAELDAEYEQTIRNIVGSLMQKYPDADAAALEKALRNGEDVNNLLNPTDAGEPSDPPLAA